MVLGRRAGMSRPAGGRGSPEPVGCVDAPAQVGGAPSRQSESEPARDRARLCHRRVRLGHPAAWRADHPRRAAREPVAGKRSGRHRRHLRRQPAELAFHLGRRPMPWACRSSASKACSIPRPSSTTCCSYGRPLVEHSPQLLDATVTLLWPLVWPMMAGSIPLGLLTGAVVYYICRNGVQAWRHRRMTRHATAAE